MNTHKNNTVKYALSLVSAIFIACISFGCTPQVTPGLEETELDQNVMATDADSFRISEPVTYKNLQVFVITNDKSIDNPLEYLTLTEALENKKVMIRETSTVNQLSIDNASGEFIFILAGDIVKGGKQDRTMGNDVVIGPQTKNIPLESYCVESGRWRKRGNEETDHFSGNSKVVASKELKLASRYEKDQSAVWQQVSEKQDKLNENLSEMKGEQVEVRSAESGTSFQLTLESRDLEEIVKEYKSNMEALNRLPEQAIGFAYAINGELYGIDLFADSRLFMSLKDKLFEAIIVEAISEYDEKSENRRYNPVLVNQIMNKINLDERKRQEVNDQTDVYISEMNDGVWFETVHTGDIQKWIHKNYISRN